MLGEDGPDGCALDDLSLLQFQEGGRLVDAGPDVETDDGEGRTEQERHAPAP